MQGFDFGRVPPMSFGAGRLSELPAVLGTISDGPALVIADTVLANIGVTDSIIAEAQGAGISMEIAAVIAGEPKEALVDDLCGQARAVGASAIVGLGGGAAMDAAKLVAAIAPAQAPAADFALCAKPLPSNCLPAIAIPTTAGTGSEVTRTSIVSTKDGTKNWYWGEELLFAHAILDPELTLSLPPHLTAWTGMDAVAHALEASTARTTSPAGTHFGREALGLLSRYLPRAVADGSDLEARAQVLWGSTLAGLALHNCNTHMGHNISHSIGSLARIHHGLATGLALEASLPWLVARPEGSENYSAAAHALGGAQSAEALPEAFAALMRSCEIAAELPEVCAYVTAPALAQAMKSDANHGMSQNAACTVSHSDLDEMAERMMAFSLAPAA